jgi:class 3 adenylate cyclase
MSDHHQVCGIVFADVVGSTRLFDRFGDKEAHHLISRAVQLLSTVVTDHSGKLVKTIGDEVMASFDQIHDTFEAASRMPATIIGDPELAAVGMRVKVGFQVGEVLLHRGDVFGDAVNVAARLTSLAKAGQVLTTAGAADLLRPESPFATRDLGPTRIRGKKQPVNLVEIVWQADSGISTVRSYRAVGTETLGSLTLQYRGVRMEVDENKLPFVLGRDPGSNLVVQHEAVSREHAQIRVGNDQFVLVDSSTNGTYVVFEDGADVVRIHREQIPLRGRGAILLGVDPDETAEEKQEATVTFLYMR